MKDEDQSRRHVRRPLPPATPNNEFFVSSLEEGPDEILTIFWS
jgi:hypothetical protein